MAEIEKDPRLQLYPAAHECLLRLETDFHRIGHGDKFEWVDYFSQNDLRNEIEFRDPHSSFTADSAIFRGLYAYSDRKNAIVLSVDLKKDLFSPYCRTQDEESFANYGHYDIVLSNDIPPTLLPSGLFDEVDHTLNDLSHMFKAGVAEVLGLRRAQQILVGLGTFAVEHMDLSVLDPKIS